MPSPPIPRVDAFPDEEYEEVFWERLEVAAGEGEDGCWEWHGANNGHYGVTYIPRHFRDTGQEYTHRIAYWIANGEIPSGMSVLHRCDNPICCNPRHLFLGTQADNITDCRRKGRFKPPPESTWGPKPKLTDAIVREIRGLGAAPSHAELARRYGVSPSTIWRVRSGRGWRWVR